MVSLTFILSSCFKGEGQKPFIPPREIRIEASVPAQVYSNKKEIALNASSTLLINGQREFLVLWSCPVYPAGHPPRIDKTDLAYTTVDSLTIGKYKFHLRVQDNKGQEAVADYDVEVLEDTLNGPPKLGPLPDQFINLPQSFYYLSANGIYNINPIARDLSFKWSLVQQPPGTQPLQLGDTKSPLLFISGLEPGSYVFGIEVTNEIGLSAKGNMTLIVLKDSLQGTSRIYDGLDWVKKSILVDIGEYYTYVELDVYEPGIFNFRNESRLDVRLWDQSKQDWSLPGEYRWNLKDNSVIIQSDKNIDSLAGKKARVQVRFL